MIYIVLFRSIINDQLKSNELLLSKNGKTYYLIKKVFDLLQQLFSVFIAAAFLYLNRQSLLSVAITSLLF